jgi:ATP-dependent helicase/nuclease subunit A
LEEAVSRPSSDVILKSQFIRAGAGAGKTTKLIGSFLDFVRAFKIVRNRFPRVVMTTFTRKATQEVKERLLVSALQSGEKDIFEYINKKSYVQISTIHGLLSLYLNQYAERMKFPQEIKIIDGVQYGRILKKKTNELLKRNTRYLELLENNSFTQLTDIAAEALNLKAQSKDFNFVQADKLRELAQKKKNDIIEMISEISRMVPDEPEKWQNYFSYLKKASSLLQQKDEQGFIAFVADEPDKPNWSNKKPPFDPLANALIEDLRKVKFEKLFNTEEYILKHQSLNELFLGFITDLEEMVLSHKRFTGELTIADLENLSLQLLEQHPETAIEFSESWDYFMVDEYQDTSPLQVRILNQIIRDKPCFVVGDPQQSIYLFRGARSEVFEEKQEEMRLKNADIGFLEVNYRSEPRLMNFMNEFFSHFSQQFKAMKLKDKENPERTLPYDAYYVKAEAQTTAALNQMQFLIEQKINPQDICVLSRSNRKLTELAVKAAEVGIPVQLQASAGFEEKREILDLIAFNRFLNNPHDNENLVTLLRSPWLFVDDSQILALAQSEVAKTHSLWVALFQSSHSRKEDLLKYLNLFESKGSLQATRQFIAEVCFLNLSEYYDKTGKREANVVKFLVSLALAEKTNGFSLGLFLEEQFQSLQSDLGASNSEAQPVVQPNCVSLMTVHASKGLQFKHVIVLGFSDLPQVSKPAKLTFDDATQMFSLSVFDQNTSKYIASDWSSLILKKFNERELKENERVLYVAMTRAIESLSLVAEVGKRAVPESSWYKRSRWPEQGEEVGEGYLALALNFENEVEARSHSKERLAVLRSKFIETANEETESASVTDMITTKPSSDKDFDYEASLSNLKKAQRGSDLHRVFEALKYLPREALMKNLKVSDQEMVSYLLEQKDLKLDEILQKGHNEWGFGLKTKTRFIQGQIDLWGELENEVHVIDYKTGSSTFSDKAFEQLAFYTMALLSMQQISSNKKIVHSVVYPVEKLIKKKEFANAANFKDQLQAEIKDFFKRD